MIIGPNGTGKSTLVCAICLGLGWATSHLGRAKDLGEFVKHGEKKAEIEIELAADPGRQRANPIITTRITKEGNNAEYFISEKKSNRKGVQALARSFSIQVDNLCQFLPQDRVVEFAALSPVDLLVQTQRAAAPEEMSEWHESLKEMRKEQKQNQAHQQWTMESLKIDENRQRLQEADVVRLRERTELQEKLAALQKLKPFPEYQAARKTHAEAKERKKEAEKEFNRLQRRLEPNLRAVEQKQHYLERINKVVGLRERLVQRHEGVVAQNKKKIDDTQTKIDDCAREIEGEKGHMKETKQSLPRLQQDLARLDKAMASPPPAFDPAEANEKVREKSRSIREIESKAEDIKQEIGSIGEQGRQRKRIVDDANREMENLQSQAGQQANKLRSASKDAAQAWEWIQNNRDRFQGEIFGPPIVECTVKEPRHADAVESMIPDGEKLAFTVTSHEDFKMLQQQLYGTMKLNDVNIRASLLPVSSFRAPIPDEHLRRYGLDRWILDLLDGPEAVLAMLCDNRNIHQTAFATREITEDQFNALQRSPISSWVTPSQTYQITRRREYGEQATSTRVQAVKKARFFTDMPVDRQMEEELNAKIREAKGEMQELGERIKELKAEGTKLSEERNQLLEEKKDIEREKADKQRALSEFNGLPAKRTRAQEKLEEATQKIRGYNERLKSIIDGGDELTTNKGQYCLDYANSVEAMRGLHIQLFEAEILQIEAKSDLEQLRAQHAEEERLLEERRAEVQQLQDETNRLLAVGKKLSEICAHLGGNLSDFEIQTHESIKDWTPEQMGTEIQSVEARLEMTGGGANQNVLVEYEQRARKIEERRRKLNELDATLEEIGTKITEVQEQWEPRLDELIGQISEAFAENFARIQCAGEVTVYKDEDFEQWAIQIKVKFRLVLPPRYAA